MKLYNNTSWHNAILFGFWNSPSLDGNSHLFRNNLAAGTERNDTAGDGVFNSWSVPVSVSDADFVSISDAVAKGPREADGSLPKNGFLRLAVGSEEVW